jgi:hypothetical protein
VGKRGQRAPRLDPGAGIRHPSRYLPQQSKEARENLLMTSDTPPDRLSTNPDSPYYDADVLARDVGIRFKGAEKTNVEEYCVSEGWIRVAAGTAKDRRGNPLTIKLNGPVEPYFREKKE